MNYREACDDESKAKPLQTARGSPNELCDGWSRVSSKVAPNSVKSKHTPNTVRSASPVLHKDGIGNKVQRLHTNRQRSSLPPCEMPGSPPPSPNAKKQKKDPSMAVALFKGSRQRGIVVVVIAAAVLLRLMTEFVPSLLGNSRLSLSSGTISTLQKNNHSHHTSTTTITTSQEQRLPPQDEQKAIASRSNDTGTNSSAPNVTVMASPTENNASVTSAASIPPSFPLVRERMPEKNTFHQWDFESFLHGPGLTEGRLASTNHSACEYVKHWPNFAHVWQQLYGCFFSLVACKSPRETTHAGVRRTTWQGTWVYRGTVERFDRRDWPRGGATSQPQGSTCRATEHVN
jgi:hypothetical protein